MATGDMVVIQIPKDQLDAVAQAVALINDAVMAAQGKAESDIAQQTEAENPNAAESASLQQEIAGMQAPMGATTMR